MLSVDPRYFLAQIPGLKWPLFDLIPLLHTLKLRSEPVMALFCVVYGLLWR